MGQDDFYASMHSKHEAGIATPCIHAYRPQGNTDTGKFSLLSELALCETRTENYTFASYEIVYQLNVSELTSCETRAEHFNFPSCRVVHQSDVFSL
jgi:hypothetical protein